MFKYLSSKEISYLKLKREKLINAYVSGVASISHNGKTTTFRSMADLRAAIDLINTGLRIKNIKVKGQGDKGDRTWRKSTLSP